MSTSIRPELSPKNCYWIEKHRYYELKHFCLQYPTWRRKYNSLISYPSSWPQPISPTKTNVISDPVTKHIDERLFYTNRMDMVVFLTMQVVPRLLTRWTVCGSIIVRQTMRLLAAPGPMTFFAVRSTLLCTMRRRFRARAVARLSLVNRLLLRKQ